MNTKILGVALFALTLGAIIYYPTINATITRNDPVDDPIRHITTSNERPRVDVVFVLDTTGSMGGLIQTAKDKIWSIATTMSQAKPTPEIRIGLVAYRDRGDDYVTKVVDLSTDLDSVYATLMDFEANGGGDGPESVNKGLYDAVHNISWSQDPNAYQVVFLVGDAPPHMDYQDEMKYPEIMAAAFEKGIIVNTIQCGEMPMTLGPWQQIASLGKGSYFQVEQAGGAVAYATPFDTELAELSAKLDDTRLYYGNEAERDAMASKVAAADKLEAEASVASLARRGAFNTSIGGKRNMLGDKELVDAVSSGEVRLEEIEVKNLPASIQAMAPAEQVAVITELAEERAQITGRMRQLADDRDAFLKAKVEEEGGRADSLDQKLYEVVVRQSGAAGLEFEDEGPKY